MLELLLFKKLKDLHKKYDLLKIEYQNVKRHINSELGKKQLRKEDSNMYKLIQDIHKEFPDMINVDASVYQNTCVKIINSHGNCVPSMDNCRKCPFDKHNSKTESSCDDFHHNLAKYYGGYSGEHTHILLSAALLFLRGRRLLHKEDEKICYNSFPVSSHHTVSLDDLPIDINSSSYSMDELFHHPATIVRNVALEQEKDAKKILMDYEVNKIISDVYDSHQEPDAEEIEKWKNARFLPSK